MTFEIKGREFEGSIFNEQVKEKATFYIVNFDYDLHLVDYLKNCRKAYNDELGQLVITLSGIQTGRIVVTFLKYVN